MPTNPDITPTIPCLCTTVVNTSGQVLPFGFLPPHGKELLANESYTIHGDLGTRLASRYSGGKRAFEGLERALAAGLIAIESTPAVHVYDSVRFDTKVVDLDNGALGVSDPCWGQFTSV